MSLHFNLFQRN